MTPPKSHEYYVAIGNPNSVGDYPCVVLNDTEVNVMLLAGYVEHVETQPDKSLMRITRKYIDEIASVTRH